MAKISMKKKHISAIVRTINFAMGEIKRIQDERAVIDDKNKSHWHKVGEMQLMHDLIRFHKAWGIITDYDLVNHTVTFEIDNIPVNCLDNLLIVIDKY